MRRPLLHLSHTDIRYDSRILKEINSLERLVGCDIIAFGIEVHEGASASTSSRAAKISISRLYTKALKLLPRGVRYAFNMLELTLKFWIRGVILKPEVVHCHDTLSLPAGVLIKLLTNCKLIYDAHELESNKNGQSTLLSWASLFVEKTAWPLIDLLISVSDSILDWYTNNIGHKKSILVLNSPKIAENSTIADHQLSDREYFRVLYSIPGDKLIFVYLGILGTGRSVETLLEVFTSSCIDAHIVFIGYGEYADKISRYSQTFHNIHFHNPVPHEQVVPLVSSADIGLCLIENVSLSDYYCLPNKLFEYCFAGLHVLASDFPEIRRVVNEYGLGMCCNLDPTSVLQAVKLLIRKPPSPIKSNISLLSWEAQADRLVRAYLQLLSKPLVADDTMSADI